MGKMWKAVGIALILSVLVFHLGAAPKPVPWQVDMLEGSVPYGTPFFILVSGPSGQVFTLNVTGVPFNNSVSVFSSSYQLSNGTVGFKNFSVNTNHLDVGAYQFKFTAQNGTVIQDTVVEVNVPVNDTLLEYQYQSLFYNYTVIQERSILQSITVAQLESDLQILLVMGLAETIIFIVAMIWTNTRFSASSWWDRLKLWARGAFLAQIGRTYHGDWVADAPVPKGNPGRIYVAGYCRKCEFVPRTKAEIERHLKEVHQIANPQYAVHYRMQGLDLPKMTRTPRKIAEQQKTEFSVDLSDL